MNVRKGIELIEGQFNPLHGPVAKPGVSAAQRQNASDQIAVNPGFRLKFFEHGLSRLGLFVLREQFQKFIENSHGRFREVFCCVPPGQLEPQIGSGRASPVLVNEGQ